MYRCLSFSMVQKQYWTSGVLAVVNRKRTISDDGEQFIITDCVTKYKYILCDIMCLYHSEIYNNY